MPKAMQILVLVSLFCVSACSHSSPNPRSKRRDQILFERATNAVQQKQFTIANLILQTLVNTYPESEYAGRAKQMLQDTRIARCGGGFSNTPVTLCDPDPAATN